MMLVLNIYIFLNVCSNKENGASLTVQILNPANYLVHQTLFRQTPSYGPEYGVCSNREKSHFNMFF